MPCYLALTGQLTDAGAKTCLLKRTPTVSNPNPRQILHTESAAFSLAPISFMYPSAYLAFKQTLASTKGVEDYANGNPFACVNLVTSVGIPHKQ